MDKDIDMQEEADNLLNNTQIHVQCLYYFFFKF